MARIFFIFFILIQNAFALEITFSVPKIPEEINLLNPTTKVEKLALKATSFSLFGYLGSRDINNNSLIYSYSGNSSGTKFNLALKNNLKFSNLNQIMLSDIVFSLNRCNFKNKVSINSNGNTRTIEIIFKNNSRANFKKMISNCPILEENNSKLFEKDFGKHTSISSISHYKFQRFVPDKRIELIKYNYSIDLKSAPTTIYFIEYKKPRKALTKLRVGSIDIILTDDTEVMDLAKNDETLRSLKCENNNFVLRKSLSFDCIDFSKIEYQQ